MLAKPLTLLLALATTAAAQRTPLEVRPRVGDTLRMRLDQTTEMSAQRAGAPARQVTTRTTMLSRAIVESEVVDAAIVLAITDSVDVSSTDENARAAALANSRQLVGKSMRLRLARDGSVTVAEPTGAVSKSVVDLASVMPATFPRDPVAVGDTWSREMPIAPAALARLLGPGSRGGVARATFRLDSLSRQADFAYVSMHGTLAASTPAAAPQTALVPSPALDGTVSGGMIVDRRRGWLSQSRFVVDLRTLVGGRDASHAATEFHMRVTQQMRVFGRPPAR
ncbi:MAG TPA: hypothetical protein VJ867_04640 [Gemmatimonadaceae bacterium]|nr:hypothetical protein [Gemmatimonadaceae bacterium]